MVEDWELRLYAFRELWYAGFAVASGVYLASGLILVLLVAAGPLAGFSSLLLVAALLVVGGGALGLRALWRTTHRFRAGTLLLVAAVLVSVGWRQAATPPAPRVVACGTADALLQLVVGRTGQLPEGTFTAPSLLDIVQKADILPCPDPAGGRPAGSPFLRPGGGLAPRSIGP